MRTKKTKKRSTMNSNSHGLSHPEKDSGKADGGSCWCCWPLGICVDCLLPCFALIPMAVAPKGNDHGQSECDYRCDDDQTLVEHSKNLGFRLADPLNDIVHDDWIATDHDDHPCEVQIWLRFQVVT